MSKTTKEMLVEAGNAVLEARAAGDAAAIKQAETRYVTLQLDYQRVKPSGR